MDRSQLPKENGETMIERIRTMLRWSPWLLMMLGLARTSRVRSWAEVGEVAG